MGQVPATLRGYYDGQCNPSALGGNVFGCFNWALTKTAGAGPDFAVVTMQWIVNTHITVKPAPKLPVYANRVWVTSGTASF